MNRRTMERRSFLKVATQAALAVPMLASVESLGESTKPNVAALPTPKVTINVRDLGAKGDGATKDTLAIQQAIERCSVLGGGEVVVPAGEYLTGSLALRSGVLLRIEKDATL